ncbi:hypothetical protein QQ045_019068 [Rhodiola kirilowii]
MEFKGNFPKCTVTTGYAITDHVPLCIELSKSMKFRRDKLLTFEAMWHRDERFSDKVKETWKEAMAGHGGLSKALEICAEQLDNWNRYEFGNVKKTIKEAKKELQIMRMMPRTQHVISREKELASKIDEWMEREEFLSRQRSRVDWLKEGNRNTRFLHAKASHRRITNKINKLV